MFARYAYPLAVLVIAAALLYFNVRAWRNSQQEESSAAELDFARRQYRRRFQTSCMLGVLAVGLCLGQLIDRRSPTLFVVFWFGVLLWLGWIVLLALGDFVVGHQHVAGLKRERRIAEAQLNAELERLREKMARQEGGADSDHQAGPSSPE